MHIVLNIVPRTYFVPGTYAVLPIRHLSQLSGVTFQEVRYSQANIARGVARCGPRRYTNNVPVIRVRYLVYTVWSSTTYHLLRGQMRRPRVGCARGGGYLVHDLSKACAQTTSIG